MTTHQVTLERGLKLFDVTMIGVGAMIGAGIFGLTGIAAGEAGPVGLLLAFFLNGVVTSMTGMSYAELGAAIPNAGGGYQWVREGMSRFWGFFAGWISWFSHSIACSLYAVLFGTFFVELLHLAGVEHILFFQLDESIAFWGLTNIQVAGKLVAFIVVILFLYINFRGASETGTIGNIITIFKIIVLGTLVVFGLMALANLPNWSDEFLANPSPLPHGIWGVFAAMGLTFVAFEGYEIIAQSGEELVDPQRNLPRAIFLSIAIVILVYLLVAFVSIGALQNDAGVPNWIFLGENGERAMIRTAERIMPYGALVMILGGLASTTSALNATVYSSSRVSFAMGRGGDLPTYFGLIHRLRRTPHVAIIFSGVLISFFAILFPIEDVAGGASLTFLVLFLLVNLSLVRLRMSKPDLERSFKVPWVPLIPYLTIAIQILLSLHLLSVSPVAWLTTVVWFILGVWTFRNLGGQEEAALEADTILLEETIAEKRYSVLLPVANAPDARQLTRMAAMFARPYDGEVFALHVIRVPQPMELGAGRAFLKMGRPVLEEAVEVGQEYEVPVRTQLRLGRKLSSSIFNAATERNADLILLKWTGFTNTPGSSFGRTIDLLSANPPCDMAIVRLVRGAVLPKKIIVPIAGGANSSRALEMAASQAQFVSLQTGETVQVVALHLIRSEMSEAEVAGRKEALDKEFALSQRGIELKVIRSERDDLADEILAQAEGFDQIIIGASEERLLDQRLFGSVPQRVAENTQVNLVMVKRYDPIKHGFISRWFRLPKRKNGQEQSVSQET
jgi:amino acid transporter/nucleotide-binding universal stress UspA family protein